MNVNESQIVTKIEGDSIAVDCFLDSVKESMGSDGKKDGPKYALHNVLVNHFGWKGSDDLRSYTPAETEALKQLVHEITSAIHTSPDTNEGEALVSLDFHYIVRVICQIKKHDGLTELGVMILLDIIIKDQLFKSQLQCNSAADFFGQCEQLIGFTSSRARDFQVRGRNFRLFWKDIRFGVNEVPGIDLEELCFKHLTKLSFYEEAVQLFGREEALRHFTICTYREFMTKIKDARIKTKEQLKQRTPKTRKSSAKPLVKLDDFQLTGVQLEALHIIVNGGKVKLVIASNQDELKTAIARFEEDRKTKNLATRISIGQNLYDTKNPFEVNKDLMEIENIHEMIDRIRAGLSLEMPYRRTSAVLTTRLFSESYFRPYWRNPSPDLQFKSFAAFAQSELGIGEELRDYLRVGRNLAKFGYVLDGVDEIDTDAMFYKIRYIDDAMMTHQGNTALIRARLAALSCREFSKFARDKDYDQNTARTITRQAQERFTEFMALINDSLEKGFAVDVIECYSPEESIIIEQILDEVRVSSKADTTKILAQDHVNVA